MATAGLWVAVVLAVLLAAMPNGVLPIDLAMLFAHGLAVLMYGPLQRAAGPARGRMWSSIAIGVLGFMHPAWLLIVSAYLFYVPQVPPDVTMFLGTGLVFTAVLAADLWTWRAIAIMSLATASSTAAAWLVEGWGPGAGWRPHHIGFPAMFLHLGIALTLFDAARRSWPRPVGVCPSCGYSLAGLIAERCPECGEVARRSAARPASEGRAI